MSFFVSTEKNQIDIPFVHEALSQKTSWAKDIPLNILMKAIDNSLCFSGFLEGQQIAFARVITDKSTFANLVDVFVSPAFRGHGFGKLLIAEIMKHEDLQGLRRFTLATADAHSLYSQFGFDALRYPNSFMEIYRPGMYDKNN